MHLAVLIFRQLLGDTLEELLLIGQRVVVVITSGMPEALGVVVEARVAAVKVAEVAVLVATPERAEQVAHLAAGLRALEAAVAVERVDRLVLQTILMAADQVVE